MLQKLKNIFHFFEAVAANIVYRFPSRELTVIGVTGTDGKTTTVALIHHLLTVSGYKTAILSTLSSAHTTTPGRFAVQKFLRRSVDNGCTHAVLEVTSIAIDQYRVWGTKFAVGVLTNIANNEHLDYHGTFENYKNTKLKFLASCQKTITSADWPKNFPYQTSLLGQFNRENILSATAVALTLGVDKQTVQKAIKTFSSPPGRLEVVVKRPFMVIVDFAHTPQAFEKVLPVVKKLGKRLIHVFGATGDRDKSKRPIMARIAAKYDNYIFVTSEDTYSEDPQKIISDLVSGLANYKNYQIVADRQEAIKKALDLAKAGDVVLLTGVGHQKSLNLGGREVPWSEPKIVKEILHDRKR